MINRLKEFFGSLWYAFLVVLVLAILTFGGLAIQRWAYPWWLSVQRTSVEQSKSFTDANNNMLQTYITEYAALEVKLATAQEDENLVSAYKAQQQAILNKMCLQVSTMAPGTIHPSTSTWLNSHGGCQ